ncbi:hypothetical protein ABZX92_34955 [Lentzea sp. NPDC006480]|uniref:hypothetical protein n=1 Tax=Lentzea sp. NPDC006480 TaxID=3157176 RepID=UPI0033B98ECA
MSLPQQTPSKSPVLGLTALVLGLVAVVVPFLPMNMTGFRRYVGLVGGLIVLVVAVLGLVGDRRGKPMAAIGLLLGLLAVLVSAMMFVGGRPY